MNACAFVLLARLFPAAAVATGQQSALKFRTIRSEPTEKKFGGRDALVALARYDGNVGNLKYVKSARMVGFNGQIILGVHPDVVHDDQYARLGVTAKAVPTGPCKLPFDQPSSNYMLRVQCSAEFPKLKLESARFALARKWISECSECTGWVLVSDFGDFFFQRKPFEGMGFPKGDELIFQEEYFGKDSNDRKDKGGRGVDNAYWFSHAGAESCYGAAEADRMGRTPMLNSGSIVGAREPMLKFLSKYQAEFEANTERGSKCDPNSIADQALLNYMFYTNAFADLKPTTAKHGEGPVNTIGMVCSPPAGSKKDHSATDLIKMDSKGFVLNNDGKPANAVHQDKVCWDNLVIPYVEPRYNIDVAQVLQQFEKAA